MSHSGLRVKVNCFFASTGQGRVTVVAIGIAARRGAGRDGSRHVEFEAPPPTTRLATVPSDSPVRYWRSVSRAMHYPHEMILFSFPVQLMSPVPPSLSSNRCLLDPLLNKNGLGFSNPVTQVSPRPRTDENRISRARIASRSERGRKHGIQWRVHVKVGAGSYSGVIQGTGGSSAATANESAGELAEPCGPCTGRLGHMGHDGMAKSRVARFCGTMTPIVPPALPLAGAVKSVPGTVDCRIGGVHNGRINGSAEGHKMAVSPDRMRSAPQGPKALTRCTALATTSRLTT